MNTSLVSARGWGNWGGGNGGVEGREMCPIRSLRFRCRFDCSLSSSKNSHGRGDWLNGGRN